MWRPRPATGQRARGGVDGEAGGALDVYEAAAAVDTAEPRKRQLGAVPEGRHRFHFSLSASPLPFPPSLPLPLPFCLSPCTFSSWDLGGPALRAAHARRQATTYGRKLCLPEMLRGDATQENPPSSPTHPPTHPTPFLLSSRIISRWRRVLRRQLGAQARPHCLRRARSRANETARNPRALTVPTPTATAGPAPVSQEPVQG
jgi:hypothetical protein